jgi:hypothetical protein
MSAFPLKSLFRIIVFLSLGHSPALCAWESATETGALLYTTFNASDHGGGAINNNIAEDAYGNLFVANEAGLLKYDGVRWIRMPETGQGYYTTAVTIDAQNRIWTSAKHTFLI